MPRIHILGASGSGTTTLGAALAAGLGCPHEDTDQYFWQPTDPPFTARRAAEARLRLLLPRLAGPDWVLSGSALKWGTPLDSLYELVVFLRLDPAVRMARLLRREDLRYGGRIAPGGDMAEASQAFLDWAESYDTAGRAHRSLAAHEEWLADRTCAVLRLDSAAPVHALVAAVVAKLTA